MSAIELSIAQAHLQIGSNRSKRRQIRGTAHAGQRHRRVGVRAVSWRAGIKLENVPLCARQRCPRIMAVACSQLSPPGSLWRHEDHRVADLAKPVRRHVTLSCARGRLSVLSDLSLASASSCSRVTATSLTGRAAAWSIRFGRFRFCPIDLSPYRFISCATHRPHVEQDVGWPTRTHDDVRRGCRLQTVEDPLTRICFEKISSPASRTTSRRQWWQR
jgi:hypothetical protein